ncbi:MAG: hypothetical protein JWP25_6436 [Bradyrhizobium sp.]|jgi:hypothetical protein|nr:hypothetical protein [Bradyrhizobium sp.]MEA2817847.1 hypothetical protein [Rhodospirillaceae bacterium]MEA2865936.1 hypothetical protein [Bradyrhizobium sp.]
MIADVVDYAIAGFGFVSAVGRVIIFTRIAASMKPGLMKKWTKRRDHCRTPHD